MPGPAYMIDTSNSCRHYYVQNFTGSESTAGIQRVNTSNTRIVVVFFFFFLICEVVQQRTRTEDTAIELRENPAEPTS
jgi:hypothetical protein